MFLRNCYRRHVANLNQSPVFSSTHWSAVHLAGQGESPAAREALEQLCRTYWYPLYSFLRRDGHGHQEAQDLTQDFFVRLLKRNCFKELSAVNGRFRSFLLAALKNFLANESDHRRARKRGGEIDFIPLDAEIAEGRYLAESALTLSAERLYERGWALALLKRVLDRLREDYTSTGRGRLFSELHAFLS